MKNMLMSFVIMTGITSMLSAQPTPEMNSLTLILKDSLNRPVEGVTISVDGKTTNSESDLPGNYKIYVNKGAKRIVIVSDSSGVAEAKIKGKSVISLTLHSEKNKKKLTKVTTNGDNTPPQKRFSTYSNIYDMIRAEVPGVRVSGSDIVIHGMTTFGGSNIALLVVDGIPTDNLNNLMPSDVKSIRVLKGPETASYGMRGANGVILFTTFRGSDRK